MSSGLSFGRSMFNVISLSLPLKVNGVTQAPDLGYNVVMKLSH
jgi:hypothetical protein